MRLILIELYHRLKKETRSWFTLFGLLFGVFMLSISMTNLARQMFHFELLPIFKTSLDGFQQFTNFLIGSTVFLLIEKTMLIFSIAANTITTLVIGVQFPRLEINIPNWMADLSIVSIVLLKAQTQAMSYASPASSLAIQNVERAEWDWAILNCRQPLKTLIRGSWLLVLIVYRIKKLAEWPLRKIQLERTAGATGLFVGGSLLLGIFYFLHDIFSLPATGHLDSSHAHSHRIFFAWTIVSLLAALLASASFILWNGLFL